MKIKVLSFALAVVTAVGYLVFFQSSSEHNNRSAVQAQTLPKEQKSETHQHSYHVLIESSIQGDNQVVLSHSKLSWHMQLQLQLHKGADERGWLGKLSDISYSQDNRVTSLVSELPFTVKRNDTRYEQLDLLGLPAEHTLQVTQQVFNLMSYNLNGTLSFKEPQRQVSYQYDRDGNTITRQIVTQNYLDPSYQPAKEQENWLVALNSRQQITSLTYRNMRLWSQQQQSYTVEQTVTIKQSLSPQLAKTVGAYMVEHYSAYDILELLNAMPQSSSALIYALQKLQTPEAEAMLVDLLQFEQTRDLDKHKVAIALGRFGASSELSLQALQSIAQQQDNQVANTALLSIGTMGYFTPDQPLTVKSYLQDNLQQQRNLSTTVLAIANSKNDQLLAQLPPLLHSQDKGVKLNSIKVLSKQSGYQDAVVSALLSSPEPRFVAAFTRTMLETKQPLSVGNVAKLKQLKNTTSNPVVIKKLTELLDSQPG